MKEEVKRLFSSLSFWAALVGMVVCFLLISVPEWIEIDLPNRPEWRSPALVKAVTPVWFGGFILLLPFCSAMACVPSQVEDIQSGFAQWQVIRSSVMRYIGRKAAVGMLGGFLVCAVSFWLHAILWNFIALPIDPVTYPEHEQYLNGLFGKWYAIAYGLPMYVWIGCGAGLCGSMTALMGLAAAVWIPDHLIAVTMPVVIYFFWSYDLLNVMFGIQLPRPSGLYNSYVTWERTVQSLMMNGAVSLISAVLYALGMKRRLRDE